MSAICKLPVQTPELRESSWLAEAGLVISALEAGRPSLRDRRHTPRLSHRRPAALRLFADGAGARPWQLITRDADRRGLGFVCRDALPLGYGGTVEVETPDGQTLSAHATVYRCRSCGAGWFEGTLYFHDEQPDLAAE